MVKKKPIAKGEQFWTEGTVSSLEFTSPECSVAIAPSSDFSVTVDDERYVALLEGSPPDDKPPPSYSARLESGKSLRLTAPAGFGDVLTAALTHGKRCRFYITGKSHPYKIEKVELFNK